MHGNTHDFRSLVPLRPSADVPKDKKVPTSSHQPQLEWPPVCSYIRAMGGVYQRREHHFFIDLLRAVACYLVVFHHCMDYFGNDVDRLVLHALPPPLFFPR